LLKHIFALGRPVLWIELRDLPAEAETDAISDEERLRNPVSTQSAS
jgi:hypothetical protein